MHKGYLLLRTKHAFDEYAYLIDMQTKYSETCL